MKTYPEYQGNKNWRNLCVVPLKPPVSPQAMLVLKTIASSGRPMSAKIIAHQLGVSASSIHRSLNSLFGLGLLEKSTFFPDAAQTAYYTMGRYPTARRRYLVQADEEFDKWFGDFMQCTPKVRPARDWGYY